MTAHHGHVQVLLFQFVPDSGADPSDVGQRELGEKVRAQVLGARLKYLQQLWVGRVTSDLINFDHLDQFYDNAILRTMG